MLKAIRNAVRRAYGDRPLDPVEFYANLPLAKAVTPDDIIVASVIQSFAKEFDKWKVTGSPEPEWAERMHSRTGTASYTLINSERQITVEIETRHSAIRHYSWDPWKEEAPDLKKCTVNGTSLVEAARIPAAWVKITEGVKATKATAAKAKAEMEANESKWNLAETLLGMKRNEFGALVPAT